MRRNGSALFSERKMHETKRGILRFRKGDCEGVKYLSFLFLALSGWLPFRNFGMPGIIIWVTFLESKHAKLLQTSRCGLTIIGSALPSPKRPVRRRLESVGGLRAGGSKVLQSRPWRDLRAWIYFFRKYDSDSRYAG